MAGPKVHKVRKQNNSNQTIIVEFRLRLAADTCSGTEIEEMLDYGSGLGYFEEIRRGLVNEKLDNIRDNDKFIWVTEEEK